MHVVSCLRTHVGWADEMLSAGVKDCLPEAIVISARRGSALKTKVNQSFLQISRAGGLSQARVCRVNKEARGRKATQSCLVDVSEKTFGCNELVNVRELLGGHLGVAAPPCDD
eukprot:1124669-Pleurochrysis_carterae.AAC.1